MEKNLGKRGAKEWNDEGGQHAGHDKDILDRDEMTIVVQSNPSLGIV